MNRTLRRVRRGAILLAVVLVGSVCGYRLFGRTWIEATYMVVITVATIGFGEHSLLSPAEQLYTIVVILVGLSASAYTLGAFFQLLTQGEVERALGIRRMNREIDRLNNHVIVCGFGRMGRILSGELQRQEVPLVVVDRNADVLVDATAAGHLVFHGDATDEDTLTSVGVQRAKSLVTVLPGDADNVFITLTARDLHPTLQIIARGEVAATQKKLLQAGATRVVLPASIGALRMASMITKPSTVELMELFAGKNLLDVEVDELDVAEGSPLIGKTVRETETRRRHGLLVVAVKRADGQMVFNPDGDFVFRPADTIIVMGKPDDITRFCEENRLGV
jgi:voltage-gated potassium channel